MTYLSHPVRRMREDPIEGEAVTLLVTVTDDASVEDQADRLAAHGTVEERLRFGTLKVTVPQTAVDAVCALPKIESIETDQTLELDTEGAGEDVAFEDEA